MQTKLCFFNEKKIYYYVNVSIPYKEFDLLSAIKQATCESLVCRGNSFAMDELSYATFINNTSNSICKKYGFEKCSLGLVKNSRDKKKAINEKQIIASFEEASLLANRIMLNINNK